MARADKLPKDPGLPRPSDNPVAWLYALTSRLFILFKTSIDAVNLLIDGYVLNVSALPTANATNRGRMLILRGGTGVVDKLYWCRKLADESFEWKEIV